VYKTFNIANKKDFAIFLNCLYFHGSTDMLILKKEKVLITKINKQMQNICLSKRRLKWFLEDIVLDH